MKFVFRCLSLAIVIACACSNAFAQHTLSYQGVVQDKNGSLLEGVHTVTVKLYSGSDTTSFWEETQHPTFSHGLFSVVIGTLRKLPPLAMTSPGIDHYMLGVTIDDGAEMTPRTLLTDAPAAFFADTAAYARAVDPSTLNFLTSINGIKSSTNIIGKGAVSVTTHNDSIIVSAPVAQADIIQGLTNRDGSIDIKNPSGPVPEISVGTLGVSTINIAKNAITSDRLAAGAVTNDRIASSAITNDKIGSGTAAQGFVLSADGIGGVVWQSPIAAALSLPFSSTLASGSDLFALTNTGAGAGLSGTSTTTGVRGATSTAAGIGILGTTSDGGAGTIANSAVNGTTQGGNGVAGIATTGNALYGAANTTGVAVHGVTAAGATTARAALFENLGSTTTGNVLEAKSLGTGSAGLFQINNTGNTSPAVDASTNGNGRAGRFQITNVSSTAPAIEATTSSATGLALKATSATSTSGNGTGFVQNTGTAGYALQGDHVGSGTGVLGLVEGTANTSRGVFGWASNTSGAGNGVYGQSEGPSTSAVVGLSNNTSGDGIGVFGQTNGAGGNAAGLYGWAANTSGAGYGVWGQTEATSGQAIVGKANATTGSGVGVYGWSRAASGVGLYGQSDGTTSGSYGVFGTVSNSAGRGVFGQSVGGTGNGVYGSTTGTGSGVLGITSSSGFGVQGQSTVTSGASYGVAGLASNSNASGIGSYGQGAFGVSGITVFNGGIGVQGNANGGSGYGVFGTTGSTSGSGTGVYAFVGGSSPTSIGSSNALIANYGGGGTSTTTANNIAIFTAGATRRFRFDNTGNAFTSGGSWTSGGADVAESFDVVGTKSEYEAGDVLVLSESATYHVAKCSTPYSKAVVGVYATAPGVLLGMDGSNDATIATSVKVPLGVIGVLPTKVTTENGAIEVGDLLVTSSTAGYAMKGDDSKLRFGNILGKAMEPLKSGTGKIRVLVGKY